MHLPILWKLTAAKYMLCMSVQWRHHGISLNIFHIITGKKQWQLRCCENCNQNLANRACAIDKTYRGVEHVFRLIYFGYLCTKDRCRFQIVCTNYATHKEFLTTALLAPLQYWCENDFASIHHEINASLRKARDIAHVTPPLLCSFSITNLSVVVTPFLPVTLHKMLNLNLFCFFLLFLLYFLYASSYTNI